MLADPKVKTAMERNAEAVSLRPAMGQKTATTRARLHPDLTCEVKEGPWTLTVAMGPKSGGSGAGPGPGTLGRGALASCLALGYAMWASRLEVPIDALDVEVQADYDARGELGVSDDIPPGYTQVRYVVTVESPAPEADVLRVLDTADRYSPYHDVFARANDVRRAVSITAPRG